MNCLLYISKVEELDSWLNRMDRNIIESIDVYNELLTSSFKRTLRHKLDQHWQDLFLGNEQYRHLSHKMKQQVKNCQFLRKSKLIGSSSQFSQL